jgi:hypothetical protein
MLDWLKANIYFIGWGLAALTLAALIISKGRKSSDGVNWVRVAMYIAAMAGTAFVLKPEIAPELHTFAIGLTIAIFALIVFDKVLNG